MQNFQNLRKKISSFQKRIKSSPTKHLSHHINKIQFSQQPLKEKDHSLNPSIKMNTKFDSNNKSKLTTSKKKSFLLGNNNKTNIKLIEQVNNYKRIIKQKELDIKLLRNQKLQREIENKSLELRMMKIDNNTNEKTNLNKKNSNIDMETNFYHLDNESFSKNDLSNKSCNYMISSSLKRSLINNPFSTKSGSPLKNITLPEINKTRVNFYMNKKNDFLYQSSKASHKKGLSYKMTGLMKLNYNEETNFQNPIPFQSYEIEPLKKLIKFHKLDSINQNHASIKENQSSRTSPRMLDRMKMFCSKCVSNQKGIDISPTIHNVDEKEYEVNNFNWIDEEDYTSIHKQPIILLKEEN